MKKTILYSQTFKGYARLSNMLQGKERTGLKIEFTNDIESATTFEDQISIDHFLNTFCIGVNYDFTKEEIDTSIINCPNCKYIFDTHSEINDNKIKPVKGDYSICFNCGEFLEFDKDLKPFVIGYDQLKNADGKEIAQLMAYQIEIKLRGRLK